MTRYIRHIALTGAVMLGTGCEESATPAESNVIPRPVFVAAEEVQLTSRVSGISHDPEAFHLNFINCAQRCPTFIPPTLVETNPLYLRSAIRGTNVLAFDVAAGATPAPIGAPAATNAQGHWLLPSVPARYNPPFFTLATGEGALPDAAEPLGPPLPPVPPTTYFRTLTLRPIVTGQNGTCVSQEAAQIGKNGIMEAVAKHLSTTTGTPVAVDDLVNPGRYWATTVFWMYGAGNPAGRSNTDGISLEVSITGGQHQQLPIAWAPPGQLPAFLNQSARGFYVLQNATISPIGVYVVLLPRMGPPPTSIRYLVKDTVTNAAAQRPWQFPPLTGNVAPGVVSFIGSQMQYPRNPQRPAVLPPPHLCLTPGL